MNNISKPIIVEQTFDSSIDNVWRAITELEQMKKWYFPNIDSFEPKVGFETQFIVQIENRIFPHLWKVTEVIPMRKISYQWQFEGYPGRGISTFELTEVDNQTKLKLTFTTLENFPEDIPEFKRESGVAGWNYFIKESLKEYLKEN